VRVLIVASWYPSPTDPTAGVFIRQQVRALAATPDVEVAVIHVDVARDFAPALSREDGVAVVRAGIRATGISRRFLGYRKVGLSAWAVLRESWGAPDIVHVQALWPAGLIGRAVARRERVPYVVTEHSEEYLAHSRRRLVRTPGMLPLVLRPLAHGASAYMAVSQYLAARLAELGLSKSPVIIPNVVPECSITPLPLESPHVISHVSVMGPAKDLESLLRATALLRRTRDDFVLKLAGEGECRDELMRLANELELDDVVEFPGRLAAEGIPQLLAESAFAVLSSTHETFSVWAAEALACGRPVVTTRCGGPEEFVTSEVGRLVTPGDSQAIADGLDWMLDHYSEFQPEALHAYASSKFAPRVIAERILDVYRSALDD
jgi:glycosyltransferase involved in cell wall biosynthesis